MDDERYGTGVVFATLSDGSFAVESRSGSIVLVRLSGRMVRHKTKIVPGDRVEVRVLAPDFTTGYLTNRL